MPAQKSQKGRLTAAQRIDEITHRHTGRRDSIHAGRQQFGGVTAGQSRKSITSSNRAQRVGRLGRIAARAKRRSA